MQRIDHTEIGGFALPRLAGGARKLLVAYSGGADSSLLLELALDFAEKNGLDIAAAHVSHGIRGDEGERDRRHCETEAAKRGIKCFVLEADVPRLARERGIGIEEAARDVRYGFFEDLMREEGYDCLLTAHNADDNLETMIFRLARGTSARGLCGIAEKSDFRGVGTLVRPMLAMTKREIVDICDKNGVKYVYDSTNSDTDITRNMIRAKVLPVLREINPRAELAALGLASDLREDCEFIEKIAEGSGSGLEISALKSCDNAILRRVLASEYEKASSHTLERTHIEALTEFVFASKENSFISLPGKYRAKIERSHLAFEPEPRFLGEEKNDSEKIPSSAVFPLTEGQNICGDTVIAVVQSADTEASHFPPQIQANDGNIYNLFTQGAIKSAKIEDSLFARIRRAGDVIDFGSFKKDVRKLYSEKKIPTSERETLLLVCDGRGIVWIPSVAVASRGKCGDDETTYFAYYKKCK